MELLLRYRRQPVAGNLSCSNAFHTLTFCLFKNQFNTVLSKPRCSKLPLHFFLIPLMRATCPVHPLFLTLLNLIALVEERTLQISLKLGSCAESSRVHLQDRRTLFYPEDGGNKILGKVGVFLTEYTASHSSRRQFSYHPKTSNLAYKALHDSIFSVSS